MSEQKKGFPRDVHGDMKKVLGEFERILTQDAQTREREKIFILDILPGVTRERVIVAGVPFEFSNPVHVLAEGKRMTALLASRTGDKHHESKAADCKRFFEGLARTISEAKRHLKTAASYNNRQPVDIKALYNELKAAAESFESARDLATSRPTKTWKRF